jgi:hypothetical protein
MRKFLLSFLSAVCMMAWGGQAAWADELVVNGTNYTDNGIVTVSGAGSSPNTSRWTYNNVKSLIDIPTNAFTTTTLNGASVKVLTINISDNYYISKIDLGYTANESKSDKDKMLAVYVDDVKTDLLTETYSVPGRDNTPNSLIWEVNAYKNIKIIFETGFKSLMAMTITYSDNHEVTINDKVGASTLCLPKAVSIPEGITAYTGTLSDDNTTLTLSTISGTIPANQPVILEGEAGKYSFPFATADAATKVGSLEGNATAAAVTPSVENATICVLDKVNDKLGFYAWTGEIPAYKAYLPVPTAAGAPAIRVVYGDEPGNVTAIESIAAEASESAPIYTLSGRQVKGQVAPGLYIKGGKKILVK